MLQKAEEARKWRSGVALYVREFSILGEVRRGFSRTAVLEFWRGDLCLFRSLVDRILWKAVLRVKGIQEVWTSCMKEILKAQKQANARQAVGNISLAEHKRLPGTKEKGDYDLWKKGQHTQEGCWGH